MPNKRTPDRRAAAVLAGLLAAALAPAPASATTVLTVGKAAPNPDPVIVVNVGEQLGIFKKHGLDLKIVNFNGGSKMATAMAAGSIDIGDGAGTEMALVAKGVPMTAVCESAGPIPFLGIGVPYDSPIHTIEDLRGKTIGFSSAGSLTDWLTRELVRTEGWGPGGVTGVAIGNYVSNVIAGFGAHLIEADIGVTPLFLSMEQKKTGRLLFPVSKYEGNIAAGAVFASNKLIKGNPAAVRAFVAAWIETQDYIGAHKAQAAKIESTVTGFPESVMARELDLTKGMFMKDCRFDAESITALKRSFADLKLLPTTPDMSKLYTNQFTPN